MKMKTGVLKKLLPVLCAALIFYAFPAGAANYAEGEAIALMRRNAQAVSSRSAASAYAARVAGEAGAVAAKTYHALTSESGILVHVKSDTKTTEELIAELRKNPDVISASPNHIVYAKKVPNDPKYNDGDLWGIKRINAEEAWDISTGSEQVYVAVIDSGIDGKHEDLAANVDREHSESFLPGYDALVDRNGHGTHVSGTIGAVGDNGVGVTGVNWKVKIIALQALDKNADSSETSVIDAITRLYELLVNNPSLRVPAVNMSLGHFSSYSAPDDYIQTDGLGIALKRLDDLNRTVIVVAAGNENMEVGAPATYDGFMNDGSPYYNKGDYAYPASARGLKNMIVVGSINKDDGASVFSNWSGKYVDLVAPGGEIYSAVPGSYEYDSGTSMATPHATGTIALLASKYPNMKASDLKKALLDSANGSVNPKSNLLTIDNEPGTGPKPIKPQLAQDGTLSKYGLLDAGEAMKRGYSGGVSNSNNSSGGGGCNMGAAALFLSALLGGVLWKRR